MSTRMRDKHLQRRVQGLYSTDPQFADARPDNEITVAISRPGLRLAQIAAIVMEGYADRPALGQRAVQVVNDPGTGRTVAELLPRFDTITYRELWHRAGAAAAAIGEQARAAGRSGVHSAISTESTTPSTDLALIRLGAVSVPLPTSTPVAQLRRIVAETKPSVIASGIDYHCGGSRTGVDGPYAHPPGRVRLPPRGRRRTSARPSMSPSRSWRRRAAS